MFTKQETSKYKPGAAASKHQNPSHRNRTIKGVLSFDALCKSQKFSATVCAHARVCVYDFMKLPHVRLFLSPVWSAG